VCPPPAGPRPRGAAAPRGAAGRRGGRARPLRRRPFRVRGSSGRSESRQ
jgi:hypothetical protein